MEKHLKQLKLSHTQSIALGFLVLIAVGTLLLMLPIASRQPGAAPFGDALFTATSAACVTGLVVQDTFSCWTRFGQCVILLLIQFGGLGFMTIATGFYMLLHRRMGLRHREILSESISISQVGGVIRLARMIIRVTLITECAGALLLSIRFIPMLGFGEGLFYGLFHSVSAFCNAGFDLMGRFSAYGSFVPLYNDWLVNLVLMFLIVMGGLGFLVWEDIRSHRLDFKRYSLHSKVVLCATGILLLASTLLFFIFESQATGAGMGVGDRLLTAMFSAVTARTAGMNTLDTAALSNASKFLTIALMFVGGSPGSTAGGIKTTTMAAMLLCAFTYIRKRSHPIVFGRRLEDDVLKKSSAVFFTNLVLALAAVLLLCHAQQQLPFVDIFFECFSAIGTVGMSTGLTRSLSDFSRVVIIFLMYCGRVGSLSFASALAARKSPAPVSCPVENITIG